MLARDPSDLEETQSEHISDLKHGHVYIGIDHLTFDDLEVLGRCLENLVRSPMFSERGVI